MVVKFVERDSGEVEVQCGMQIEAWTIGKRNSAIEWLENALKWSNFRQRRWGDRVWL